METTKRCRPTTSSASIALVLTDLDTRMICTSAAIFWGLTVAPSFLTIGIPPPVLSGSPRVHAIDRHSTGCGPSACVSPLDLMDINWTLSPSSVPSIILRPSAPRHIWPSISIQFQSPKLRHKPSAVLQHAYQVGPLLYLKYHITSSPSYSTRSQGEATSDFLRPSHQPCRFPFLFSSPFPTPS